MTGGLAVFTKPRVYLAKLDAGKRKGSEKQLRPADGGGGDGEGNLSSA